jgi:hypothetical protein
MVQSPPRHAVLKRRCSELAGTVLALLSFTAAAHEPGSSRLVLRADDLGLVELRWDVALADADLAVQLDAHGNHNGVVEPNEAAAGEQALFAYALQQLRLSGDGHECRLEARKPMQVAERPRGRSLVLRYTARCPAQGQLQLHSTLLLDVDRAHRSLLRAQWGADRPPQSAVLAAGRETFTLRRQVTPMQTFADYFGEGIHHVLEGWDHLLFLLALFLPAVLQRTGLRWRPAASFLAAFSGVVRIITAFTLAHAFTLVLAATGIVNVPSRWVESAVAASVLFTAVNNLFPLVTRRLWLLAAAFGLIHGSAMAGALLELGLPAEGRTWALLGFNLGVEAAQLGLVVAGLPLAFALRRWRGFVPAVLWPGSVLVALAGLVWFLDRALNLGWPLPI